MDYVYVETKDKRKHEIDTTNIKENIFTSSSYRKFTLHKIHINEDCL